MIHVSLRVWSSPSWPVATGFEIVSSPLAPKEIAAILLRVDSVQTSKANFLLVPLATSDRSGVEEALKSAQIRSLAVHICFAIDRETLDSVDSRTLDGGGVGLVLDDVNESTPPSAIARDAIEAVRLSSAFIRSAATNVRMSAAMRATLGLARDLGLGTLGDPGDTEEYRTTPVHSFDYVPKYILAPPDLVSHGSGKSRADELRP